MFGIPAVGQKVVSKTSLSFLAITRRIHRTVGQIVDAAHSSHSVNGWKMKTLESRIDEFVQSEFTEPVDQAISNYHKAHLPLICAARGSSKKHQAWSGGYKYHIEQCLDIGDTIYAAYNFPFTYRSVFLVLYFHDIEKIFKYVPAVSITDNWFYEAVLAIKQKEKYYTEFLPEKYDINFSDEELNALKYIHGEGDDYCDERVMNELAGLCHACDVMSARCFHNKRILEK